MLEFSLLDKQMCKTAAMESEMENEGAVRWPTRSKQFVKTAADRETMHIYKHRLNDVHKQGLWCKQITALQYTKTYTK